MTTWDDVRAIADKLPRVVEGTSFGAMTWRVGGELFVWERPLRRPDLAALQLRTQPGPVVAASCEDEGAKFALINGEPDLFFTTPHFDGHRSVLAWLDLIPRERLQELIDEAWWARAPLRIRNERHR